MDSIKYVVRFFLDNKYLYSIHCDADSLDDLLLDAKDRGKTVKIVAYKSSSDLSSVESEV